MDYERKKYEDVDFLTGLYNRKYYLEILEILIEKKEEFAIFSINLNHFKLVNDVHGHDVGDLVLKEVGRRLKHLKNEDLIFVRFGGDEFAAVYRCTNIDKINELGKKIDEVLMEHIVAREEFEFAISAAVGVARFPDDASNMEELLKLADMAMYNAKKSGQNNQVLVSDEMHKKMTEKRRIIELFKSIDIEKDLYLEYLPVFDVNTDRVIGVEALVRWRINENEVIEPDIFIPIAEEVDMVKYITKWVFIEGLTKISEWNKKYNKNLKLSLNVADACIHNKIFFGNVKTMLRDIGVKPEWVALELKEKSLIISPDYMKKLLREIAETGIDIYIDDFNTSPIIISSLKDFNVGTLKIDNEYIQNITNEDGAHLVRGMICFAKEMGLNIIAEGVEEKEQYEIIKKCGCDAYQGFFRTKPIRGEVFEEIYLKKQ